MIEILGAGIAGTRGSWLFRRLCARIESGSFVGIVSDDRRVRSTLFDVMTGARVADEGRVWIDGVPVMAGTRRRIRSRIADLRHREPQRARTGQAHPDDRSAPIRRAVVAAVGRGQTHVILPDLEDLPEPADWSAVVEHVRRLTATSRISVFVGAGDAKPLRGVADRLLILAETPQLQLVS